MTSRPEQGGALTRSIIVRIVPKNSVSAASAPRLLLRAASEMGWTCPQLFVGDAESDVLAAQIVAAVPCWSRRPWVWTNGCVAPVNVMVIIWRTTWLMPSTGLWSRLDDQFYPLLDQLPMTEIEPVDARMMNAAPQVVGYSHKRNNDAIERLSLQSAGSVEMSPACRKAQSSLRRNEHTCQKF